MRPFMTDRVFSPVTCSLVQRKCRLSFAVYFGASLPQSDADIAVTDWENIAATNRALPDLTGWQCTVGRAYPPR